MGNGPRGRARSGKARHRRGKQSRSDHNRQCTEMRAAEHAFTAGRYSIGLQRTTYGAALQLWFGLYNLISGRWLDVVKQKTASSTSGLSISEPRDSKKIRPDTQ